MAKSEFLEHQDQNNDGLIDVCEEMLDLPPVVDCPTCLPNPSAIVCINLHLSRENRQPAIKKK